MVRGPHCCGRLADAAEERLSTSHIRTRCSSTQQEPPIKARQVYSHGGRSRSGSLITADSEVVRGASACTSARSSRHSALDVDQSVSRQRWHVVEVVDNHSFAVVRCSSMPSACTRATRGQHRGKRRQTGNHHERLCHEAVKVSSLNAPGTRRDATQW